jgi:hypothetical protein
MVPVKGKSSVLRLANINRPSQRSKPIAGLHIARQRVVLFKVAVKDCLLPRLTLQCGMPALTRKRVNDRPYTVPIRTLGILK